MGQDHTQKTVHPVASRTEWARQQFTTLLNEFQRLESILLREQRRVQGLAQENQRLHQQREQGAAASTPKCHPGVSELIKQNSRLRSRIEAQADVQAAFEERLLEEEHHSRELQRVNIEQGEALDDLESLSEDYKHQLILRTRELERLEDHFQRTQADLNALDDAYRRLKQALRDDEDREHYLREVIVHRDHQIEELQRALELAQGGVEEEVVEDEQAAAGMASFRPVAATVSSFTASVKRYRSSSALPADPQGGHPPSRRARRAPPSSGWAIPKKPARKR